MADKAISEKQLHETEHVDTVAPEDQNTQLLTDQGMNGVKPKMMCNADGLDELDYRMRNMARLRISQCTIGGATA